MGRELPDPSGENGCHSDSWPSLQSPVSQAQLLGRQAEGSRVDGAPEMGLQGLFRAFLGFQSTGGGGASRPASLSAEDRDGSTQSHPGPRLCPQPCLSVCQRGCCPSPAHELHGRRTRQPSPAVYTIRGEGSPAPGPGPWCPASRPGAAAAHKCAPGLASRVSLPCSHAGVHRRAQPGVRGFQAPHDLLPTLSIRFPIHTRLGVQLPPKLGHFSSTRQTLPLFSSLEALGSRSCVLHLD